MKKLFASIMVMASLVGCATVPSTPPKQGMVVGIQNTTMAVNDPNLAGAAIGGIAGGVVGNQFGKGNGKKAMTILGALGGAAVGSQVNAQKLVPGYRITLRANDGEVVNFNSQQYIPVGQIIYYKNINNNITIY